MTTLLVTVFLVLGGKPAPHAWFACNELTVFGWDDGSGVEAGWSVSDSRGAIVFEGGETVFHCWAINQSGKSGTWQGTISPTKNAQRFVIELQSAQPAGEGK